MYRMLSRIFLRLPSGSHFYYFRRHFLPQAYQCNEKWNSRLSHDAFKNLSARDLGIGILQTVASKNSVSPLDYDIFANKLHELDVISLDFMESIIDKYSHTQSALTVIDSSCHAIVRAYLQFKKADRLLDLLQRKAETGVFLDFASANLLLDYFIDSKDWTQAVAVVWELCLQNYFSSTSGQPVSAVTVSLALRCVIEAIQSGVIEDSVEVDADGEDSEEVEYQFVKYIRNPNDDNFFDIRRRRLRLGFALLQLSDLLTLRSDQLGVPEEARDQLLFGSRLFGLAFTDKLNNLTSELQLLSDADQLKTHRLSIVVVQKLLDAVSSSDTRPNGTPVVCGAAVLPTMAEVDLCTSELQRLIKFAAALPQDFLTTAYNITEGVLTNSTLMEREIRAVEMLYERFEQERGRAWNQQLELARQTNIIDRTKTSLHTLLDEEERLTYFRQQNDVMKHIWLAPRTRKERSWSRMKEWRRDIVKLQEKESGLRDS